MRWKSISLVLAGMAVLVSACSSVTTPSSPVKTGALLPPMHVITHTAQAYVPSGKVTSVSVSCQPGEQLLGGGFSSSNLFEYDANIAASYPSSATTWTVTAALSPDFDVEAAAYCIPATVPLSIQILQASGATGATVACPEATVLLSGGAQGSQPLNVSRPYDNGWMGTSYRGSTRVYALCAARHGLRGQVVTAAFNARSSSHQYAAGGGSATCPAGLIATGGGFAGGGDQVVGSQATGSGFTGWSVVAGGDADVTIAAVCWGLQG